MKTSLFSASALGAFLALTVVTAPLSAATYDKMVVFGDSLSDNGNLSAVVGSGILSMLNYDPYRITSGPATTPASAFTGVAVEHLNDLLGLPALTPSLLGGTNYSWAYAKTGLETFDFVNGVTPGTGAQVGAYLLGDPTPSPDTLHVLWAGSNDLFSGATPAEIEMATTVAIANLTGQLTALLSAGAQHVMWFNLPDLSLTPRGGLLSSALAEQLQTSSLQFRTEWAATIQGLRALFPAAEITGVDVYGAFNAILADPASYGISNPFLPAQGNIALPVDESLFWDFQHPTSKTHSVLGNYAYQQLQPVPEPATYGLFAAAGLGVLIALRRRTRTVRVAS